MSNDKYDPVLISLIRNTIPSIMADEILSVQPMGSPFNKEEWPYQIDILPFSKYDDVIPMKKWCRQTLEEGQWISTVQFFAFKNEESLNWFKLRWL